MRGRYIGWFERAVLFAFVIGGAPEAAAIALAAKSFARFPTFREHQEGFAEYFLIGSLASIADRRRRWQRQPVAAWASDRSRSPFRIEFPPDASLPHRHPEHIKDVNTRYHDAAADEYDAKWGIDFGESASGRCG